MNQERLKWFLLGGSSVAICGLAAFSLGYINGYFGVAG